MPQTDYILREIEKIGAMLRMLIRRLVEQKDTENEEETTEQTIADFSIEAGISLDEILQLKSADFSEYFSYNKGYSPENVELLADFMAELTNSSAISDKEALINKAIELYEFIDAESKTFSLERAQKISNLLRSIEE